MELSDEEDPLFYESSYTRNGCYDQFVLFLLRSAEIVYPDLKNDQQHSPEVAYEGDW